MDAAKLLVLALVGLAEPAAAQIVEAAVSAQHSDSIRLKIERMVDPGLVVTDPACPSGIPVPGVSVTRSAWPGMAEYALPPTPAMCQAQIAPQAKSSLVLTGPASHVRPERIDSRLTQQEENTVAALGAGRACSAVNTIGQGC